LINVSRIVAEITGPIIECKLTKENQMEHQEIESQQEFNGYIAAALLAIAISGVVVISKKVWNRFNKKNQEVTE
jgi:hypothetical protein